jgi:hypothetical protein
MFFILFLPDDRRIRILSLTNGSGSGRPKNIPYGSYDPDLQHCFTGCFYYFIFAEELSRVREGGCDGQACRGIRVGRAARRTAERPAAGRRVSRPLTPGLRRRLRAPQSRLQ